MPNVSASASSSAAARVEYDPARRRISLNRVFQIPQMFRPAVSSFAGATIGRVNLERPAIGLTAVASWFRFARWRRMHPVEWPTMEDEASRVWMYQTIIQKERLDDETNRFLGIRCFSWRVHCSPGSVTSPIPIRASWDSIHLQGYPRDGAPQNSRVHSTCMGGFPRRMTHAAVSTSAFSRDTLLPFATSSRLLATIGDPSWTRICIRRHSSF